MLRYARLLALPPCLAACSPHTDLLSEPAAGAPVMDGPVRLVEPTAGAVAPPNLAEVVVRLALPLRADAPGPVIHLRPDAGAVVATEAAVPVGCRPPGVCYAFAVASPLTAAHYAVEGPSPAFFETGAAVPEAHPGAFTVAREPDRTPPFIDRVEVEAAADCLRVRFVTDEPVRATVLVRAGGVDDALPAGEAATAFDVAGRFTRVPAGAAQLVVQTVDWAGNGAEAEPVNVDVVPPAPPLVISEILSNPAGPELTQEFVEIRNLGAEMVPLAGLFIEDGAGGDALPAAGLAPGGSALVVPAAFDPLEGHDPGPRDGTLLLRVEGRIGRDGISNTGEPVRLRRKDGRAISQYGGWVDTHLAAWNGRSIQRTAPEACDHPSAWTVRPQAPTPGW